LADRQGVEELVGQQQQRAVWDRVQPIVPGRPRQASGLERAQPRGGLDQVQRQGGVEIGGDLRHRPQRVGHQGAAARAGLHQQHGARAPQQAPGYRRPQAQQLAEHLADLGCGGEVGERIVGRVVGGVGARHERVQSLRTVRLFGHGAGWGTGRDTG
jgi:hypothetical protein